MTSLPDCYWVSRGNLLAGEYPGSPNKDAAGEKLSGLTELGVDVYIDLTEEGEWSLVPYDKLLGGDESGGAYHFRMPIRDLSVPTPREMVEILDRIDTIASGPTTAYLHCWGGVGRTGTVAACWLTRLGMSGQEALDALQRKRAKTRKHDRPSPETEEQRAFVRRWPALDPMRIHPGADPQAIRQFACRVGNGYDRVGGMGPLIAICDALRERFEYEGQLGCVTPVVAHAALFYQAREQLHIDYGDEPDRMGSAFARALVAAALQREDEVCE